MLRKRTPNLPTSDRSCRLNPPDQLGRLCVYGIYRKTISVPAKKKIKIKIKNMLADVDTGGKNTQEQDQIRL